MKKLSPQKINTILHQFNTEANESLLFLQQEQSPLSFVQKRDNILAKRHIYIDL
jgi:hypothetical protein